MKFKKHPFSPWMFPSLKIKDAYLHAAGHVKTQRKTQSSGENETTILSAPLCTFPRVDQTIGCFSDFLKIQVKNNLHNTIIKQTGKKSRRKTDVDRRKNCAAVNKE